MALLLIGMGAAWPGLDGLLHIAGNDFFSNAQYVFLGVGAVAAIFRAWYGVDYSDMDWEARDQGDPGDVDEIVESLWED
jgi:hypothetical protein